MKIISLALLLCALAAAETPEAPAPTEMHQAELNNYTIENPRAQELDLPERTFAEKFRAVVLGIFGIEANQENIQKAREGSFLAIATLAIIYGVFIGISWSLLGFLLVSLFALQTRAHHKLRTDKKIEHSRYLAQ